jgi:hypothetical protein
MARLLLVCVLVLVGLAAGAKVSTAYAFVPSCTVPGSGSTEAEAMAGVASVIDCRFAALESDIEVLVDRLALLAATLRFMLAFAVAYAFVRFIWNAAFKQFQF